jgi:hypothetical protein
MPPCSPTIFDIGPLLSAFLMQSLILAGALFGLYRVQQTANNAVAAGVAKLANGGGLIVPAVSPNPNEKKAGV